MEHGFSRIHTDFESLSGTEGLIAKALQAIQRGWIPPDLLRSLVASADHVLLVCIRELADPTTRESEAASLARLLQKLEQIQKFADALLAAERSLALAAARALDRTERGLDIRLASHLQSMNPDIVMRSLELLEVIEIDRRLIPVLFGLLSHDEPRIQSKASLLVQKIDDEFVYTRRLLQHSDARVRANAVQGLASRKEEKSRVYLMKGAEDSDHRVRSQAAVGLAAIGDPAGKRILLGMIHAPDALERRSAAWALGCCGADAEASLLGRLVRDDPDEGVRELAEQSIRRIHGRSTQSGGTGGAPDPSHSD